MMNDPAVQQQVQGMLQNPEVIDQLVRHLACSLTHAPRRG